MRTNFRRRRQSLFQFGLVFVIGGILQENLRLCFVDNDDLLDVSVLEHRILHLSPAGLNRPATGAKIIKRHQNDQWNGIDVDRIKFESRGFV